MHSGALGLHSRLCPVAGGRVFLCVGMLEYVLVCLLGCVCVCMCVWVQVKFIDPRGINVVVTDQDM